MLLEKGAEPPVLAVAEDGSAVVPLLGGLGGVNGLAREIAAGLGVAPAITTSGELRFGTSRHPLRAGDVVGCPAGGPETAHAITNTGTTELRYLAFSSQHTPEICDYPDSGKTGWFDDRTSGAPGAAPQTEHVLVRHGQVVDYWDGE